MSCTVQYVIIVFGQVCVGGGGRGNNTVNEPGLDQGAGSLVPRPPPQLFSLAVQIMLLGRRLGAGPVTVIYI